MDPVFIRSFNSPTRPERAISPTQPQRFQGGLNRLHSPYKSNNMRKMSPFRQHSPQRLEQEEESTIRGNRMQLHRTLSGLDLKKRDSLEQLQQDMGDLKLGGRRLSGQLSKLTLEQQISFLTKKKRFLEHCLNKLWAKGLDEGALKEYQSIQPDL